MSTSTKNAKDGAGGGVVPILIDGQRVRPPRGEITGGELRQLADPPIAADRDLWLDVDGDLDRKIEDDDVVQLKPQMGFFSVPREINPGAGAR